MSGFWSVSFFDTLKFLDFQNFSVEFQIRIFLKFKLLGKSSKYVVPVEIPMGIWEA